MRRFIAALLAAAIAVTLFAGAAIAEAKPSLPDYDFWAGDRVVYFRVSNLPEGATVKSVTSSKPARLEASLTDSGYILLKPLKKGDAKITVKYKVGKKTKSFSNTYHVGKYPSPLKKVTVNGNGVSLSKNKYACMFNQYELEKTTVSFKPNKNWTVVKSTVELRSPATVSKTSAIKDGKRFKIPDETDATVRIVLENKLGEQFTYFIYFFR